jgi:hypothetical protein
MDAHRHGHGRIPPGDLFQGVQVGQHVERQAVPPLGNQHAEKSERAELIDRLPVEGGLIEVAALRAGSQLVTGEAARQLPDLSLLVGEQRAGVRAARHDRASSAE